MFPSDAQGVELSGNKSDAAGHTPCSTKIGVRAIWWQLLG